MKNEMLSFSAVVEFAGDSSNETFDVEVASDINSLVYDDVENAICDAVDAKHGYSLDDFEDAAPYKIVDIVINEDGESYPVVPEDADLEKLDNEIDASKYLVLPWARYALTPEAKLWMKMKDEGIIDEDAPFDFEKYHRLVNDMK